MREFFSDQAIAANLLLFLGLAGGIWLAGSRLTYLADTAARKYRLAASTVGLVFLALATSLPEVVTTMAAAVRQDADLVLNNLFGGIALQTAILAVADFWAKGAISNYPRKANHALEATLLVALMACLQVVFIMNEPVSYLGIGLGSTLVGLAYIGAVVMLRWYDDQSHWVPVDLPEPAEPAFVSAAGDAAHGQSSARLVLLSLAACLAILALGTTIVELSQVLAVQTGLGSGFLGVTLLAAATSLPELSTTITAVRMGAYTLAISNVFGSNLIMVVLVWPADMFHTSGPILGSASPTTHLAIATGILVTTIYLTGLLVRRKGRVGQIGIDSFLVLATYVVSVVLYYHLR